MGKKAITAVMEKKNGNAIRPLQGKSTTHIRLNKVHVRAIDDLGAYVTKNYARELSLLGVNTLSKNDIVEFMLEVTNMFIRDVENKPGDAKAKSVIWKVYAGETISAEKEE